MINIWQAVLGSAVIASIISSIFDFIRSKIVESKNNKRNNYVNNVIAHKVDNLDNFKMLYSKFMSNCSKVKNIILNNDSGDLNELLKEIEIIKYQLQLSIDDSFIEYREFMTYFERYAFFINSRSKLNSEINEEELKIEITNLSNYIKDILKDNISVDDRKQLQKIQLNLEKKKDLKETEENSIEFFGSKLKEMSFIYIFFENIWIEKNLRSNNDNMSKIYSEAEEKYDEIFLGKMKNNESKSIKINDNNYVPIQAIGAYISQLKLEKRKNK